MCVSGIVLTSVSIMFRCRRDIGSVPTVVFFICSFKVFIFLPPYRAYIGYSLFLQRNRERDSVSAKKLCIDHPTHNGDHSIYNSISAIFIAITSYQTLNGTGKRKDLDGHMCEFFDFHKLMGGDFCLPTGQ